MTLVCADRSIVALRDGLISAEIDGELVLMCVSSGHYVAIGGPGVLLTEMLLEKPRSFDVLCAAVCARYDVENEFGAGEIALFLERMCAEGLAEIHDSE